MFKITDNIYQGGLTKENTEDIDVLVTLIQQADGAFDHLPNVKYRLHFPIEDSVFPGIKWLKTVVSCIEHFEKLDFKIYIHCRMGISRSAMVTIAYLMKTYNWSFNKARDYLGNINDNIYPNPRFCLGLKEYERLLNI